MLHIGQLKFDTVGRVSSRKGWQAASLDGPTDPDAKSAWDAEIQRRIEAIEAGTIRLA